jgi:hypothetical protein
VAGFSSGVEPPVSNTTVFVSYPCRLDEMKSVNCGF